MTIDKLATEFHLMEPPQRLEKAWEILQRMPADDKGFLMMYLAYNAMDITEDELFKRFVDRDIRFNQTTIPEKAVEMPPQTEVEGFDPRGDKEVRRAGSLKAAIHQAKHVLLDHPDYGPLEKWRFEKVKWKFEIKDGKAERVEISREDITPDWVGGEK